MFVKLALLSVLVTLAVTVKNTIAQSNEFNSKVLFPDSFLTIPDLSAIKSNMQELNSKIEGLEKTVQRIETRVTILPSPSLYEARNLPQTCAEISDLESGLYRIQPQAGFSDAFEVYCEQQYERGGWTVIQNRYDGSVNFFRGWKEYEDGFGDLRGEFWLGLRKIHELTYVKRHELHVVLEDFNGTIVTAQYDRFIVEGSEMKYNLNSLGNYTGTAGDSLALHLGNMFTTIDKDNDWWKNGNCAQYNRGCWWYNNCGNSNLNGLYREGTGQNILHVMFWYGFPGSTNGLKRSRMMIRPFKNI
ncbi:fibrinogen C domain-containing protein 1-like [Sabethes cyaneus]|uniref:fibrinogen C domain-containing protein 1-like n=1 Tax=Sabethes cyaneus TaxID=53552 RepID=UPI00237D77EB|nr:fibrinogen C domain-containing protein 1-like [Sabethes cyaneus]